MKQHISRVTSFHPQSGAKKAVLHGFVANWISQAVSACDCGERRRTNACYPGHTQDRGLGRAGFLAGPSDKELELRGGFFSAMMLAT